MSEYKLLSDISQNLTDIFTNLLFGVILLMLILKLLMPKRYHSNIKTPNIYIFEYEAQAGQLFSFYNILTLLIKILSYGLFSLAILFFCQKVYNPDCIPPNFYPKLFSAFIIYIILKFFLEELYLRKIKKTELISKIRLIRLSFENYLAFYLFIIAFLTFFLPEKNNTFFVVIVIISTLWIFFVFYKFYNSLKKHIDIKKYQIILYLCILEILPFISLIGWIIFQIL